MKCYLIMTVLGGDRPGLVSSLSETVAKHGGNWLESRMARLAGQFAGIVRIECPEASVDALLAELHGRAARRPGLSVQAVREAAEEPAKRRTLVVDVMGNDRPGIVRELTTAIANAGGNVEELTTGLESAPMSGHPDVPRPRRDFNPGKRGNTIPHRRHRKPRRGPDGGRFRLIRTARSAGSACRT